MNYDRYFIMSCLLGDELYKPTLTKNPTNNDVTEVEKRFERLLGQPIGDYIVSGMPTLKLAKKVFLKL